MDLATIIDGADRFVAYIEGLTSVIGRADQALPLRDHCAGLLTAEGRKSVEPMAAVTAYRRARGRRARTHYIASSLQSVIASGSQALGVTLSVPRGLRRRSASRERVTPVWPAGKRDQASSRTSRSIATVSGSKNASRVSSIRCLPSAPICPGTRRRSV